jgi:hypothetical protein
MSASVGMAAAIASSGDTGLAAGAAGAFMAKRSAKLIMSFAVRAVGGT